VFSLLRLLLTISLCPTDQYTNILEKPEAKRDPLQ
jgi:hypothetical protein